MDADRIVHHGGCHCKRVRWEALAPKSITASRCNCSMCSMRGNTYFTVPSACFKLVGDSEKFLTAYTFGTHAAKHTFCKVCGIASFYTPRSSPEGIAFALSCVDPGTLVHLEITHFDGRNWERSYALLKSDKLGAGNREHTSS